MRISIIAAMDEKRGIGKGNELLFKIPEDFKRMKALTSGHPIIMGRKTFESIGRVLPNRTNIIITRDASFRVEEAVIVHSLEEAIAFAKKVEKKRLSVIARIRQLAETKQSQNSREIAAQPAFAHNDDEGEIFIFGGGQIFTQALPLVDRLYLTVVKGDYGADTFFPNYSQFSRVIKKEEHTSGEYKFIFLDLEK